MNKTLKSLLVAAVLTAAALSTPSNASALDHNPYWKGYWGWYDNTYSPYYHTYYGPSYYGNYGGPAYNGYYSQPSYGTTYVNPGPYVTPGVNVGRVHFGWW
jgi:hypothetical protein